VGRLFDDEFMKKLEFLYLLSKKKFAGKAKAHTRSKKVGWGMEFADYRDYTPGDDPRYLDWNLYARVGQLVTKLFHEEENLSVYFLLDTSLSMDYGHPSKYDYGKKVVAALAYVALANLDTVSIWPFAEDLHSEMTEIKGKARILKVFDYLENLPAASRTDLVRSMHNFVHRVKSKGLLVLVSDFWDESGYEKAVKLAVSAGFDCSAVCLHHDFEAAPKWRGSVTMNDCESGRRLQVNISGRTLKRYRQEYEAYQERLKTVCHALRTHYLYARTSLPFEDIILEVFRQGQFVK